MTTFLQSLNLVSQLLYTLCAKVKFNELIQYDINLTDLLFLFLRFMLSIIIYL